MICVIILTLDEEANIERAVASAKRVGDVLVVDSGSTDATASLAVSLGARFETRPWEGFARQRNAALDLCTAYDWVIFLDADETFDDTLIEELALACVAGSPHAGLMMRRMNYFLGKKLRYAGRYPDWQLRGMRPGMSRFEDVEIHERAIVDGTVGALKGNLVHQNSDSASDFLAKHSGYAQLEATSIARRQAHYSARPGWPLDRLQLRRLIKDHIWLRLPARGLIRIIWLMGVKGGIRDGRAGWAYAKMLAAYECMIDVYLAEARLNHISGDGATRTPTVREARE